MLKHYFLNGNSNRVNEEKQKELQTHTENKINTFIVCLGLVNCTNMVVVKYKDCKSFFAQKYVSYLVDRIKWIRPSRYRPKRPMKVLLKYCNSHSYHMNTKIKIKFVPTANNPLRVDEDVKI